MADDNIENSVYEEEIVVGTWSCPNCDTVNPGSRMKCVACGQAREEVEFRFDEEGRVLTDESEIREALSGPDWICDFCGTSNKHVDENCAQCGATRSTNYRKADTDLDEPRAEVAQKASKRPCARCCGCMFIAVFFLFIIGLLSSYFGWDKEELVVQSVKWERFIDIEKREPSRHQCWEAELPDKAVVIEKQRRIHHYDNVLVGTRTVVKPVTFRKKFSIEDLRKMTVSDLKWSRSIKIEKLRLIRDKCWEDDVPFRATILTRRRELFGYRSVPHEQYVSKQVPVKVRVGWKRVRVGVQDLGNGRFKVRYRKTPVYETRIETRKEKVTVFRREAVYRDRVDYKLEKWKFCRKRTASGGKDQAPEWPRFELADNERLNGRTENYQIVLSSPGEDLKFIFKPANAEEYAQFRIGDNYRSNGKAFELVFKTLPASRTVTVNKHVEEPVYEKKPVYRSFATCTIWRWKHCRVEKECGGADKTPVWPDCQLSGDEREGGRRERYLVTFRHGNGKTYTYRPGSADELEKFKIGAKYLAVIRPNGSLRELCPDPG